MTGQPTVVLVVGRDAAVRSDLASWLEAEGCDALMCPGPQRPDYTCVAGRGGACALAVGADVVVLDLALESDVMMTGTPGWQLLLYYVSSGKPVVAIVGDGDSVRPLSDDQVAVLRRPTRRAPLVDAVRAAVARATQSPNGQRGKAR